MDLMSWHLFRNLSSKKLHGAIQEAIGNLTELNELYVSLPLLASRLSLDVGCDLTTAYAGICRTLTSLEPFPHLCLLSNT
jgi:hypothetical protein